MAHLGYASWRMGGHRALRRLCSSAGRERMDFDVVIVGAGPAGLSAAIKLKQLGAEKGEDLSVCVVEKGAEVGAHILSGNVFEPRALNELIPDWKERGAPISTKVESDTFSFLTEKGSYNIPNFVLPKQLHNDGNYVISLGQLSVWLGEQAEELGVEVYPGFAASEVLYSESGDAVVGIATKDVGIAKDGTEKGTFERGIELRGRQTILAEGARGSCSEEIMAKLNLRGSSDAQTYGLGIKEVWRVAKGKERPGFVQHTLGWPLQSGPLDKVYGGSFLYHMEPDLVLLGMVVGLNYENPYLNPYKEFQRWKHHPAIKEHLEGGECISYGARCLNEGGYHALPRLSFKGGALLGCSAGLLNSVKIKGTHTAMKSGIVAGEAVYDALTSTAGQASANAAESPIETDYQERMDESWVMKELKEVRNCHASFKKGLLPGMVYTGLEAHILKGKEPWTFKNSKQDWETTQEASSQQEIVYPKPDGVLSFDLLTNLQRSGTNHEHDQPSHLKIKAGMEEVSSAESYPTFAGPEQRFCPAGVYEYNASSSSDTQMELTINAQNCVHCKCCSIKMPKVGGKQGIDTAGFGAKQHFFNCCHPYQAYIDWTVPEGGGGPAYTVM
ncbi:unnamed protein product [Chrysoparadoxa australica]